MACIYSVDQEVTVSLSYFHWRQYHFPRLIHYVDAFCSQLVTPGQKSCTQHATRSLPTRVNILFTSTSQDTILFRFSAYDSTNYSCMTRRVCESTRKPRSTATSLTLAYTALVPTHWQSDPVTLLDRLTGLTGQHRRGLHTV